VHVCVCLSACLSVCFIGDYYYLHVVWLTSHAILPTSHGKIP